MEPDLLPDTGIYQTAGWRKALLGLVVLIVVGAIGGFALGAIVLAQDGIWVGTAVFGLMALIFVPMLIFVGVLVLATFRIRVELADGEIRYVLPRWNGPTPVPPYHTGRLGYDRIAAVEQREEIYRALGFPGHVLVSRIVPRSGAPIVLGYVNVGWSQEPPIPFPEIAGRIAERAGLEITSRGGVEAGGQFRAIFRGAPHWDAEPMTTDALVRSRARTARIWKIAGALILILIAARMALGVFG